MPAAVTAQVFTAFVPSSTETVSAPASEGFFARLGRAFIEARMKQAEREVAQLIERGGGRLTDSIERQIERHFV